MLEQLCISIVVPVFNGKNYIKKCFDNLLKQDFKKPYEIIVVDDGSTDESKKIIRAYSSNIIQFYSLPSNMGPAAARDLGLKKAKGEYIFFLDVDDHIAQNTLTLLYNVAKQNNSDMVLCDKKWIEGFKNQRENIFIYPVDKNFENSELVQIMKERFYDPISFSIFGLTGRLIKRSIITENNIFFEKKLRYLEDETFIWDILGYIKNISYVRKQLYSYYVKPNANTALSEGIHKGYPIENFKLVKTHIQNSLKNKNFSSEEIKKLGDQALIYLIIRALVSYSRSIILGKVNLKEGIKCRKKIIDEIINDYDVSKAIKNYKISDKENPWIPRAILWRSKKFLEFFSNRRGKEILKIRRNNKK